MDFKQFIDGIPKTEIHIHLDGAFTLKHLFKLINKYESVPKIKSLEGLKKKFEYKDFSHFINTWFWKNSLYREPIDFEESVFYSLKELFDQNIVYIEAFISPWDYYKSGLNPQDIVRASIDGINRVEELCGIKCRLIVDITRDHGHETAMDRLDEISQFLGDKVIGVGLGGSEHKYPASLFKEVFLEAKRRGFHCVAHAGEVSGPESIWSAINDLKIERIGHGVRATEDPELIEYLVEHQLPLEVCINSNIKTGVYPNYQEHTLPLLVEKGVFVTLNSDDPTMFGASLSDEYLIAKNEMGIKLNNINRILNNTIEASFATSKEKNFYKKKLNSYWITNINELD